MNLTAVEKIAARHADGHAPGRPVRSGDFIIVRPRHVMTHDNTGAVIPKFKEIFKLAGPAAGGPKISDPHQPVFAIDHDIQNTTPENLGKYAKIEAFASEQGVDFYPAGTGISHQVMIEQGYVAPGAMVVGSDSHSNIYGALACLGTPVVRTDAASLWASGTTWWQVPPVARVTLTGRPAPGIVGKDVIVALCGLFNKDQVLNHAVEFVGDGLAHLPIDQRMSIANMSTEWGALAALFPFDEPLRRFLLERAKYFEAGARPGVRRPGSRSGYTWTDVERWWDERPALAADRDAAYAAELELDLASVVPYVSGPNDVKTMSALPDIEVKQVRIQKAWLMSCVNGRLEDLAAAAAVLKGRRVAEGVEFYVAAASADIQADAQRLGYWKTLVDAGAVELPPGCGTCIGLGKGLIKAGEVGISATNRNFEGRMGDKAGLVYLGSPAVVAASAAAGYICAPRRYDPVVPKASARAVPRPPAAPAALEVIDGFPARVKGRLWFLDRDNLNTDGIYAGKHTYNDAMTPAQQAAVVLENYDPDFRARAKPGDVILGGLNFGTGSSREQAATALKHFGVPCVIAASFSETYKRNAFNNGFVVFECPELVAQLRQCPNLTPSLRTRDAGEIEIDFTKGVLTVTLGGITRSFPFPALSKVAQNLVVAGGAERAVAQRLAQ